MKKIFLAFAACFFFSSQVFAQWTEVTLSFSDYHRDDALSVVSSQTAFLLSHTLDTSILSRTTDGGNSWETKYLPGWADTLGWGKRILFTSSEVGYLYGHRSGFGPQIYKTIDGGETWTNIPLPVTPAGIILMHFFDSERGVLMLRTVPVPFIYSYEVFTTQDGGQTWMAHAPLSDCIVAYHFQSDGSGIGFADFNPPKVLRTTDFGATWELLDSADVSANWPKYRQFITGGGYFINDTVGYKYYLENTTPYGPKLHHLTKTTDGGNTWIDDGLIWLEQLFEGGMKYKDGSLWIFTSHFVFRNAGQSTNTEAANTKNQVAIAPNPLPSGSAFQLQMSDNFSGRAEVQILHSNGAIAQRTTVEILEGRSMLTLENFPAGIYFVTVRLENQGVFATGKLAIY